MTLVKNVDDHNTTSAYFICSVAATCKLIQLNAVYVSVGCPREMQVGLRQRLYIYTVLSVNQLTGIVSPFSVLWAADLTFVQYCQHSFAVPTISCATVCDFWRFSEL